MTADFFRILIDIILPIFLIIGTGFIMDRLFTLDIKTLSRLNFYVFVPAFLFKYISESGINVSSMTEVGLFCSAQMLLMFFLARIYYRKRTSEGLVFTFTSAFYNAGNFGIPFFILVFGEGIVDIVAVIILIQNLFSFLLGIIFFQGQRKSAADLFMGFLKIPVLYAVVLALGVKGMDLTLPVQVSVPVKYLGEGLIPIALVTLGAQLSRSLSLKSIKKYLIPLAWRHLISPLTALALTLIWPLDGEIKKLMILAAGLPVAVNVYILAEEYNVSSDTASQLIFWSTLLSAAALPVYLIILGL